MSRVRGVARDATALLAVTDKLVGRYLDRPSGFWVTLVGAVLVAGVASVAGLRLIRSVEMTPEAVADALRLRSSAASALAELGAFEADFRASAVRDVPEQALLLVRDAERVRDAFGSLRQSVAKLEGLSPHVDSAERAVMALAGAGSRPRAGAGAVGAAGWLRVLGAGRVHLRRIVQDSDLRVEAAERGVRAAHARAEALWIAGTGGVMMAVLLFAALAQWRRARLQLAARELDLLLGALPFALLLLDGDGRIRQSTGFVHRVFGFRRRDFIGARLADLVCEADRERVVAAIRRALAGAAGELEVVTEEVDGIARALAVTLAALPGSDGAVVGVSGVVRDVTGERALKAQALQAERLASVGTLVAGVSHELKNPLAAIASLATVVDRASLSEDDRAAVDTIASEAARAGNIVRNLLDFSRRHAGRREPTSVQQVIERTVSLLRHELRSLHVDLDIGMAPDLPPVLADLQELQQVLLNLLVNAEHAVRGRATRRIVVRAILGRPGWVRVTVDDTGPGVPPEKRELIFEPFFTTKPAGEGTGLGLALVRGIITEHGGRIRVEDAPDGGARFLVELPALSEAGLTPAPPPSADATPAPAPTRVAGSRVLIADDEPANRQAFGRLLERLGYSVTAVADGQEALDALAAEEFTLVLVDAHMPNLDGVGFYDALVQRRPEFAGRVAFVTGAGPEDPLYAALVARGCPILRKPFDVTELRRLLEGVPAPFGVS